MATYQAQEGDYRVQYRQSAIPTIFYYTFWQYTNGEWHFLYDDAPEVVMVENLRGREQVYSADGYDYWRQRSSLV